MEKILINTADSRSEIRVGEDWRNISGLVPASGIVIVTDENVRRLYGKEFPTGHVITIPAGETSKCLGVIEDMAGQLLELGFDRNGFILAIGGGVVCDIAGFLAAIFMRGIRCAFVSTTLLSQVDASTGGKNGVNLSGVKNILGTFKQPELVICDPSMLTTLPEDEYYSGLAELIKTAIIGDRGLFDLLEQNSTDIKNRNAEILEILISRAVRFKASIVSGDEKEQGLRMILNFGHTFGHAIEMERTLKHGFAVAAGMELAAAFSYESGLCNIEDKQRIIRILNEYDLTDDKHIHTDVMHRLMSHDKKKAGDEINFVFTSGIGNAIVQKMPVAQIIDFYKRYIEKNNKQ